VAAIGRRKAGFEYPADGVERAVQVVGGGPRAEMRPEQVHRLLLVQPMVRLQGEQLDERRGLAQPPRVLPDDARANRYPETAQHLDADDLGPPAQR
jgi:hypothetical protein